MRWVFVHSAKGGPSRWDTHICNGGSEVQISADVGKKSVAIFSIHGGVGKSLLAANLGVFMARQTRLKVGLVDLNLGGGAILAERLRVGSELNVLDWFTRAVADRKHCNEYLVRHSSGLFLLSGTLDAGRARCLDWRTFQAGLEALGGLFDLLIADLHPAMDMPAVSTLRRADLILLLTRPERSARVGLERACETLDMLKVPRDRVRLVFNPSGCSHSLSTSLAAALGAGLKVYPTLVWDPKTVAEAEARECLPVDLPRRPLGRSLRSIAERVRQDLCSSSSPRPANHEAVAEERQPWRAPLTAGEALRARWERCREAAFPPVYRPSSRRTRPSSGNHRPGPPGRGAGDRL